MTLGRVISNSKVLSFLCKFKMGNKNKFSKRLTDLPAIWGPRGIQVTNREHLAEIVDLPLVKACQILFDKGIRTICSSANSSSINLGHAIIEIDMRSLSPWNKNIALGRDIVSRVIEYEGQICIPVTPESTVDEVRKQAIVLVEQFESQK